MSIHSLKWKQGYTNWILGIFYGLKYLLHKSFNEIGREYT